MNPMHGQKHGSIPRLFGDERLDRQPEAVEDCRRAKHNHHTQALWVVVLPISEAPQRSLHVTFEQERELRSMVCCEILIQIKLQV